MGSTPGWSAPRGEYAVRTTSNWKRAFTLRRSRSKHLSTSSSWWEDPLDPVHVLHKSIWHVITHDNATEFKIINGAEAERVLQTVNITPHANFRFEFPELPGAHTPESISQLHDVVDLNKVIVISGFGEVGPWGFSHTRWEMEAKGHLTLEGCIKMVWMIGYFKLLTVISRRALFTWAGLTRRLVHMKVTSL